MVTYSEQVLEAYIFRMAPDSPQNGFDGITIHDIIIDTIVKPLIIWLLGMRRCGRWPFLSEICGTGKKVKVTKFRKIWKQSPYF